jgi:hypothetical protein
MNGYQSGWDRLQRLLENLTPGDEVLVSATVRTTGLDHHTCLTVFEALTRAELLTRTDDDVFVRRRMHEVT